MSKLPAPRGTRPSLAPGEFDVEYLARDGARHTVPLADAARVRLADMAPARLLKARKGQRHLPGLWWSATDGRHVGYESWLERDQVLKLTSAARSWPGPSPDPAGCLRRGACEIGLLRRWPASVQQSYCPLKW